MRYELKNAATGEEKILHLNKEQQQDATNFVTADGVELETVEKLQVRLSLMCRLLTGDSLTAPHA